MFYEFTPDEIADAQGWEAEIAAFETEDRRNGTTPNSLVFCGSSSIVMWDSIQQDFADVLGGEKILRRGFGGSQISDTLYHYERVLAPHAPRLAALYAGDNDIASGKSAQRVFDAARALCERTWQDFPQTHWLLVAVKPSPSRWHLFEEQSQANKMLQAYSARDERLHYVDIVTPMLSEDGRPRRELFIEDELHMNADGYALWTEIIKPHLARLIAA
jgi:lysophospholipase L1-like esterase